jgi:hypothetical protein
MNTGDTQNLKLPEGRLPDDPEATRSLLPNHLPPFDSPHSVILVFADNNNALSFELTDSIVLGRRSEVEETPDVDLAPYGAYPAGVSRRHIRLTRLQNQLFLEDLGARNGTFYQGKRLTAGQVIVLKSGSALRLATLKCWIYFTEGESQPTP